MTVLEKSLITEEYENAISKEHCENNAAYEDPNAWNEADVAMLFGNNSFIKEIDCKEK